MRWVVRDRSRWTVDGCCIGEGASRLSHLNAEPLLWLSRTFPGQFSNYMSPPEPAGGRANPPARRFNTFS